MTFSDPKETKTKNNSWKGLVIWILLALFLRWQVIEPRWIPSGSMLPTLEIKDKILVEKITPKLNRIFNKKTQTESIVVFRPPQALVNAGYEVNQALIKRVVGIPGDKIEVKDGQLIRNNQIINEPWVIEEIKYDMPSIIVPRDSIWVLGDNRNNSLDSHLWGPLPAENLVGSATFRYWPLKKIGFIRFPAKNKST